MGSKPVRLVRTNAELVHAEVATILELTQAAGDADGAYPLSEHVMLHLRGGGEKPAVHVLAWAGDDRLVGYAHIDTTDPVEGAAAELCVHPLFRRHGIGRALVAHALEVADEGDGRLRLWAHGDHPSASALALSMGFTRGRVLWQMRRSLFAPLAGPVFPPGITVRPFRPGVDDDAWLALNALAFADLPDQGRWTRSDLSARLAESWFDADGFLLAFRGPDLVGFHWTKVHGSHRQHGQAHQHDPIGEVYVIGVHPSAHGTGLGTALTLAGLRYLRDQALDQVMLYVDETNTTAISLYQRLDFARWSTDVSFRRSR